MAEEPEKVRISKLMSQQGLCSRREADSYIERGWVLLDGVPVTELGTRAFPHQKITLTRNAQSKQDAQVTILLHKPVGYVSGQAEDGHAPAATLVQPRNHWRGDGVAQRFSPAQLRGLAPAGILRVAARQPRSCEMPLLTRHLRANPKPCLLFPSCISPP